MARGDEESVRSMLTRIEGEWEDGEKGRSDPKVPAQPGAAPQAPAPAPGGPVVRATVKMARPEVPRPPSNPPPRPTSNPPPVTVTRVISVGPPAPSPELQKTVVLPSIPQAAQVGVPVPAATHEPDKAPSTSRMAAAPAQQAAAPAPQAERQAAALAPQAQQHVYSHQAHPQPAPPQPAPSSPVVFEAQVVSQRDPTKKVPSEPPAARPAHPVHGASGGAAAAAMVLASRETPSNAPAGLSSTLRPQLPPGSGPLDQRLVLVTEPDSARAVAFRLLRDTLLSKDLPRVLAVAGTAPHDGVTTCAVNVALALAEQPERRVLLVDGNFAAPALARIFSMDGFTPPSAASEALLPLKLAPLMDRFHVAAIVRRNGEAPPRFDKIRFQRVLAQLAKDSYDYIVIDAGALKGGSAAGHHVTTADATLLAVRAGRTTARALRRATNQIPPGRAVGVTLVDDEPHD